MTEISTEKLVDTIIEGIQNRKGERIVTIDLRKIKEAPAEYMVIAEALATLRSRAGESKVRDKGIFEL